MDSSPEPSPKQDSEVEVSDQEDSQKEGSGNDDGKSEGSGSESEGEQGIQRNLQQKRQSSESEEEQQSSSTKRRVSGSESEEKQSSPIKRRPSGSESDGGQQSSPPKRRTSGSGSEKSDQSNDGHNSDHESQERKVSITQDIFGSDSGSDDDDDQKPQPRQVSRSPSVEREGSDKEDGDEGEKGSPVVHRESQEYEDDDVLREEEGEKPLQEIRIDAEVPRMIANLGTEMLFVKFPNFLSVDTHPYDPSWYEDEIDEDEHKDEEGKKRLKLKVENTIRWKSVPNDEGHVNRESNARMVKWSDGSLTLHLGSEIFDVHKNELLHGDNNHLFVRQGLGLQGQAVFRTKLSFRPHSTDSFTHRKITLSLADKSSKTNKIRVLPNVGLDPEAKRSEKIKKEEDKLKAAIRRENKQKRTRERAIHRGPSAAYLEPDYEEEDEDGGISLSAIKSNYKSRVQDPGYGRSYSPEDSGDDSDFDLGKVKSEKKKARIVESDDED